MSITTNPGKVWDHIKSRLANFFHPIENAYDTAAEIVSDEIERIGPDIFYPALNVGLALIATSNGITGELIMQAAEAALKELKAKGIQAATATVISAAAAALAKLHVDASS